MLEFRFWHIQFWLHETAKSTLHVCISPSCLVRLQILISVSFSCVWFTTYTKHTDSHANSWGSEVVNILFSSSWSYYKSFLQGKISPYFNELKTFGKLAAEQLLLFHNFSTRAFFCKVRNYLIQSHYSGTPNKLH